MVDILSWDKSIDKHVKTSDDKKVGNVRAVTTDFMQIQKGYFRTKSTILCQNITSRVYDGDHIWLALTEDQVKQFESEKESPLSSFDNAQYGERKSVVEKQYPQFSTAIPT